MAREDAGIQLMMCMAVATTSSQCFSGIEACASKVNVVSVRCRCFLSTVPFW